MNSRAPAECDEDRDREARLRSLDPAQSILLQAPAGSGKTEVLTQRFLRLLAVVNEPEEILAITFTRKAAAEMRARILRVLDDDIDAARPTAAQLHALRAAVMQRARLRAWDLQELRMRLRIQTIDSLNHELARAMPLLGESPAALAVTDDARALYRAAARQSLHAAERAPEYQPAMDLVFRRLDNNWERAEQLFAGMLERRAQWLPTILNHAPQELADAVERGLSAIVTEALERVQERLGAAACAQVSELLRQTAAWRVEVAAGQSPARDDQRAPWRAWLEPGASLSPVPARLREWQALAALLQTQTGGWRKQLTVREGFPRDQKQAKADATAFIEACSQAVGLQEQFAGIARLPDPKLGAEERDALGALARLLRLAAATLRLEFRDTGRVDHTEVAAVARTGLVALGGPTELALRRATALKHLLIDEFQDTSVEQNALLETLIVGWEPGSDRSLFAVGDPMQSIYQFRSAEVALFLRARERGLGDVPLTALNLTRNFRSIGAMVEWCNTSFAAIFPPRDEMRESAVSFLPAQPGRHESSALPGGVRVCRLADDSRGEEARLLAAEVVAARERRPSCSVAVLVQAASQAPPLIQALRQRGLTVRGVDLEPLSRQPAVRDVVELGCAMLHSGDRVAWLAVLRSPCCGLSLADLFVLTADAATDAPVPELLADEGRLAALSDDGRTRLARCAPVLLAAHQQRLRGEFVANLRTLWQALGGPAALSDSGEWEQVQAYLDALATRLDETERPDGEALRDLAESLRLGGDASAIGSIEILTIHRAKGLEWDVVMLPGLHRAMRGDDRPLLSWIELPRPDRDADLLMAALSIGRGRDDDRLGAYIAELRKQRQRHERSRLAYVAATRARHELHLFAYAQPDKDGRPQPRAGSMLKTFWPALQDYFAAGPVPASASASAVTVRPLPLPAVPEQRPLRRLPSNWELPRSPAAPSVMRFGGGADAADPLVPEYLWAGQRRRAIGTVVHAELERLAKQGETPGTSRAHAWQLQLRELGLGVEQLAGAVEDVAAVLAQVAADERARWILSGAHANAASELRLSGIVAGELRDVVIDRTFVDDEGVRWVIDYKTGTHQGANLEGFLASELERYRPQLEVYRELASGLGPQPVRAALYFPLLRRFVELQPL